MSVNIVDGVVKRKIHGRSISEAVVVKTGRMITSKVT